MSSDIDRSEMLFSLRKISCSFGSKEALKSISVEIPRGGITAICGLSASGKSTLLSILGLVRTNSHSGSVNISLPNESQAGMYRQMTYEDLDPQTVRYLRSVHFGFILQSSYLMPTLTAEENVLLPLHIRETSTELKSSALQSIRNSINRFAGVRSDLETDISNLAGKISGGQKQRFGIIRALIHNPSIVFADEPCANLDPAHRDAVMQLLLAWKDGMLHKIAPKGERTLVLISHDIETVVKYADHIILLGDGELLGGRRLDRSLDLPESNADAKQWLIDIITGSTKVPAAFVVPTVCGESEAAHSCSGSVNVDPASSIKSVDRRSDATSTAIDKDFATRSLPLPWSVAKRVALSGLVCDPHHCGVTALIVLTLGLVCAAWFLTAGLMNGGERVSEYRLKSRPLARRLMLGNDSTDLAQDHIFAISESLQKATSVDVISPFSILDWQVDRFRRTRGRTIDLTENWSVVTDSLLRESDPVGLHPLLQALELAVDCRDRLPANEHLKGIFLCPRLLHRMFGSTAVSIPGRVRLDLQNTSLVNNGVIDVPVLGALRTDPPENVYFLCPRSYANELLSDIKIRSVRFWPLRDPLRESNSESSQAELHSWQVATETSGQELGLDIEYKFNTRNETLIVNDNSSNQQRDLGRHKWELLRDRIRENAEMPDWWIDRVADDETGQEAAPAGIVGYNMIEVFLDDVDDMPKAVDAVRGNEELKGNVDRVIAELVKQLRSFAESGKVVLTSVRWILSTICFVCLLIIQILRMSQKRAEAAMLRIIGYSPIDLLRIVACDSAMIWFAGILVGTAIGAGAGNSISWYNYSDAVERSLAYRFEYGDMLKVMGVSFLIVEASGAVAAVLTWMRKSPAELFA